MENFQDVYSNNSIDACEIFIQAFMAKTVLIFFGFNMSFFLMSCVRVEEDVKTN